MDRQQGDGHAYKFGCVQIFKSQELGHGTYGAVYKAKCDALPCAAKFIYPAVLFGSNVSSKTAPLHSKEQGRPTKQFKAECNFIDQIKHPNIVQYLGMYCDPDTNAPVLLMELMDESLTHFLEAMLDPVLFHSQVNILHDTALALEFLHLNGIVHRDLSSNNVLLIAGSRAKVTDFEMSTLTDVPAPHRASLTQCPGTSAYMPPETLSELPKYSEKLDCFSFGVLIVQVITRKYPDPADQFQSRERFDSQMQRIQAQILVPELERRQSHISLIPVAHPLQQIALVCLKDNDIERPAAQHLCKSLEQLKTTPLYASSIQQVRDQNTIIRTQKQKIRDMEQQLRDQQQTIQQQQAVVQEVGKLRQNIQAERRKNEQLQRQNEQLPTQQQLERVQQEVQQLRQQVRSSEEHIAELQQGVKGKDRQIIINQLQAQLQQTELKEDQQEKLLQPEITQKQASNDLIKLTWRKGPNAPVAIMRGSSIIIGDTVYINPYNSQDVYAFHCDTTEWSTLSQTQCPCNRCTLSSIDMKLTTVGGEDPNPPNMPTNKVLTHCDEKWVELYPPMTTARCWAAVLSTTTHLAVMGGEDWKGSVLETTEILDMKSKQWSIASPLPYSIIQATATLCEETIYLMGGDTLTYNDYSVLSCQLSDLVQPPVTQKQLKVWHRIADLPARNSTCVTVQGHVLAIGGGTAAIYRYDLQTNDWSVVNNSMATARSYCLATVLSNESLLVVGGGTGGGKKTDDTEISIVTIA